MEYNVPTNLKYTSEHEWTKINGDIAEIGITDFAQSALGDIVFVELPEVGSTFEKGSAFGVVESIKSVSDLYSPLTGEVTEVNTELQNSPELCNKHPYESWIIKMKLRNQDEVSDLLSAEEYKKECQG